MAKKIVKAKKDPQQVIKTVMNAVLIGFIIVSIGYAAYKNFVLPKKNAETTVPETAAAQDKAKIKLYYLHTTGRCYKCNLMEKYAKEAVDKYFPAQLADGSLEFLSLNVDEPQNAHLVQDYQLVTKSLVVSVMKGGKEEKFENLKEIWTLVGNQEQYIQYVKTNVEKFLKELK